MRITEDQLELLEKLLRDEIRSNSRTNLVQEKKYSERLLETLRKREDATAAARAVCLAGLGGSGAALGIKKTPGRIAPARGLFGWGSVFSYRRDMRSSRWKMSSLGRSW